MGFFYFDESIHERGGFILGAFVYSDGDLSQPVADALSSVGLQPGIDEFKSGGRDEDRQRRFSLRHLLRMVMQGTKVGAVLSGIDERHRLGEDALIGLTRFIEVNKLGRGHVVVMDQGVMFSRRAEAVDTFEARTGSRCSLGQDSRMLGGLQVADLAAHSLSTMVLETMGLVSKKVRSGRYLGYGDDDLDVEIGFELWVTTRHCLFQHHFVTEEMLERNEMEAMTADTATYALYISPGCSPQAQTAALEALGKMYMGCIY
jgi:hypothetical protein